MTLLATLKERAGRLKHETYALYLAARHPDTPIAAKVLAAAVAAYAFSPIDLIPDFIPVLGYLDDLLLVPLGIAIAVRMVPAPVMAECRSKAAGAFHDAKPVSRTTGAVVVIAWLLLAALCVAWILRVRRS